MTDIYFFDTYALWEIIKKNPDYERFITAKLICSIFNVYELYATLRREFDKDVAEKHVALLQGCLAEITIKNVIDAAEMKKSFAKKEMSFVDCLGYVKAKELKIKFLTGDKEFEGLPNVEFVK